MGMGRKKLLVGEVVNTGVADLQNRDRASGFTHALERKTGKHGLSRGA